MNRTKNRTIAALLAGTALVVGLAACGTPTEAAKISSAPEASTSAPADASEGEAVEGSAAEEPAVDIQTSFKVGETAKIGDWEVTVTKVSKPTAKQIKGWNEFNDKAKGQYVVANYTAKYVGTERTKDVQMDLTWKFGGTDGQVYDTAFLVTGADENDAPTEARPGGKIKQDAAFDVPVKAVKGGVVTVEGYTDGFEETFADFAF
jgi:hypothetical protein